MTFEQIIRLRLFAMLDIKSHKADLFVGVPVRTKKLGLKFLTCSSMFISFNEYSNERLKICA
jgi:hypothetical protein